MALRFFADQCVPRSVIQAMQDAEHEILLLKDFLPVDAPDNVVIAKALELDCILLSVNGDFADIVTYPPVHYSGIITLQIRNRPRNILQIVARLNDYLKVHAEREHYKGTLLLVEVHRIRIRA